VKLIGENEVSMLGKAPHFLGSQETHVYSSILEPAYKQIFFVSVWTKPKHSPDSKCVYADEINLFALDNMRDHLGNLSWAHPENNSGHAGIS
jgi:hypothetical protein